jgi:propionyl-CoA synthetase
MQTVWARRRALRQDLLETVPGKRCTARFELGHPATRDGYLLHPRAHDDVINVAGHRLGTREIEESISSHPNVAEVAVVGVADPLKGQVAMAFVVPRDASGLVDDAARLKLEGDIMKLVDDQLGAWRGRRGCAS